MWNVLGHPYLSRYTQDTRPGTWQCSRVWDVLGHPYLSRYTQDTVDLGHGSAAEFGISWDIPTCLGTSPLVSVYTGHCRPGTWQCSVVWDVPGHPYLSQGTQDTVDLGHGSAAECGMSWDIPTCPGTHRTLDLGHGSAAECGMSWDIPTCPGTHRTL